MLCGGFDFIITLFIHPAQNYSSILNRYGRTEFRVGMFHPYLIPPFAPEALSVGEVCPAPEALPCRKEGRKEKLLKHSRLRACGRQGHSAGAGFDELVIASL